MERSSAIQSCGYKSKKIETHSFGQDLMNLPGKATGIVSARLSLCESTVRPRTICISVSGKDMLLPGKAMETMTASKSLCGSTVRSQRDNIYLEQNLTGLSVGDITGDCVFARVKS